MPVKNIIAKGIGFSPSSVSFIPTHGFSMGAVVAAAASTISIPSSRSGGSGTSSFELILTDDRGATIAELSTGLALSASKVVNGIGEFTWVAPPSFDRTIVKPDQMFQLWYEPSGGVRKLWNVYFLRRFRYLSKGFEFGGPDINGLLWRRIVAAYTNSTQSKKTAMAADDMMKEVVRESLLDTADPTPTFGTRAWANLTVQADGSLGPTISKSFPFDKLMTFDGGGVLPILARAAAQEGIEVFYAIQPNVVGQNSINFEFRTFIGQPGQDVSETVVFDQDSGNLLEPDLELDYSREENYIYGTGQGTEDNRDVQQVWDAGRIGQSIWGRAEGEADSRNQNDSASVIASANSRLWEGNPKIRFTGKPVDTEGTAFANHWDVGDLVTTKFEVIEFLSIIRAATLSVDDTGRVSVDARLDYNA
jgi:hypothetical protein